MSKLQVELQLKRFRCTATRHENHAGNCFAMTKSFTVRTWLRLMIARLHMPVDSW